MDARAAVSFPSLLFYPPLFKLPLNPTYRFRVLHLSNLCLDLDRDLIPCWEIAILVVACTHDFARKNNKLKENVSLSAKSCVSHAQDIIVKKEMSEIE